MLIDWGAFALTLYLVRTDRLARSDIQLENKLHLLPLNSLTFKCQHCCDLPETLITWAHVLKSFLHPCVSRSGECCPILSLECLNLLTRPILKGYPGVNIIHGLTHHDNQVRPPLVRLSLQTASSRSFSNLRNGCTTTRHCRICLQQETAIKKPHIMVRTVPNFSSSASSVSAHRSRHQTSASLAGFLL